MNLATATATEHDKVTCSYENFTAEIENQLPDLDNRTLVRRPSSPETP